MRRPLSDALWSRVNEALDAGRSPWESDDVLDWLAEHPDEFAPLARALERVHAIANSVQPMGGRGRVRLAAAAGFVLAALLPFAARSARAPAAPPSAPPRPLTVHALEIQVDRATPRGSSLHTAGPFAYVDVRVETRTHRNPRR